MDTALPELESGAEPADRPLWGTAHAVFVNGKSWNVTILRKTLQLYPILSALAVLPELPILILEAGCGQSPRKAFLPLMPILYAKNSKNMYRIYGIGNTIIRKEIRQHESDDIRQQISTYLIHIRKDYFP